MVDFVIDFLADMIELFVSIWVDKRKKRREGKPL